MKRLIRLSMAASALTVILLLVSSMQSQSLKASSIIEIIKSIINKHNIFLLFLNTSVRRKNLR